MAKNLSNFKDPTFGISPPQQKNKTNKNQKLFQTFWNGEGECLAVAEALHKAKHLLIGTDH